MQLPQKPYTVLIIRSIEKISHDYSVFEFENGHGLQYESGQFLTLVQHSGSREIRRSYSIISSPVLNEHLAIGIKRVPNGLMSRRLVDSAKIGDEILSSGTGGFFRLPGNINNYKTFIFFAAGSGITPVYSLIKTLLHTNSIVNVYLIYSNRSPDAVLFYSALKKLEDRLGSRFNIEFLFSTAADLRKAHLNREGIIQFLEDKNIDPGNSFFYTCGPEAYMRMIIFVLQLQGVSNKNIRKEDFIPNKVIPVKIKPPVTDTYFVTLQFRDRECKIMVRYPDTILQAAKKEKISLPYSCETGKCGNCAAQCLSGKVWLSYNEVLTDHELEKGIILTCVGHPQNGDVILKIDNN